MKKVSVSEFRSHLYRLVRQVQRNKRSILITRFGKPIAEIRPIANSNIIGFTRGRAKILGNIISPASDPDDLEVLRD